MRRYWECAACAVRWVNPTLDHQPMTNCWLCGRPGAEANALPRPKLDGTEHLAGVA